MANIYEMRRAVSQAEEQIASHLTRQAISAAASLVVAGLSQPRKSSASCVQQRMQLQLPGLARLSAA